jgi:cysteine desulfurase/selenocysteine lyase
VNCPGVPVAWLSVDKFPEMKNINEIRADFPLLDQTIRGKKLVYFDNAATTQKPRCVIDAVDEVYTTYNANIHRGVHYLGDMASDAYESAREKARNFINAGKREEIVFTHGTTSAINAVAFSFGERYIKPGNEIIISNLEHHANIVPWQMMCDRKKAKLKVIPADENGELMLDEYERMISDKTRLVAVAQVSNALGTFLPVNKIITTAHSAGVPVLVDGAQSIQHGEVDVKAMDCDFYVFSSHKIYGPAGTGILYGKEKYLEEMPPYQGGGDMVEKVTFEKTTYNELPFKFEAGTTNYPGAIGLGRALDYISDIGIGNISIMENELLGYAMKRLSEINELKIYGNSQVRVPIISFLINNIHFYDAGTILDKLGIAVRTGNHCAQPVMDHFGINGTIRASMCFYNTMEEVDIFAEGIRKVIEMFL